MMKKIGIYAGTVGLMMVLLAPAALAQNEGRNASSTGNTAANLCTRLETQSAKMLSDVSDRVGKIEMDKSGKTDELGLAWNKFESERQNSRSQEDANLSARLSKLNEMSKSDTETKAISDFRVAIQNALNAKRAAIDAATKTFHDGVDSLMNSRNSSVSTALSALKAAFQAASDKVKADCLSGVAAKTVRANFLNAVQSARKNYDSAKKSQDDFSAQMKVLVDAKQAAFKKAQSDFKSAIDQARNALKAALGENTNATSTATSSNP